jgi:hypothetical protein
MQRMRLGWMLLMAIALVSSGCVSTSGQDRFLRIHGLICTSTQLERPRSWEKNKDAAWVQERLADFGADSPGFLAAVEWEEPFKSDRYAAVWIAGSSDAGLLIATRDYQVDRLLYWLQGENRQLGAVPTLQNLSVSLAPGDLKLLEDSLRHLSPHRCTDTVKFFPDQQRTYHVQVRLAEKETEFAVFAPALKDYQRAADRSIRWLAQYHRLSRREADVVAVILDFADKRLMYHLKVGSRSESTADQPTGDGFTRPQR